MRKIGWFVGAVLIVSVCGAAGLCAGEKGEVPAPKAAAVQAVPFEPAWAWKKLGANAQQAWLAAKQAGNMEQQMNCFVRVEEPYDDGDRSFLISKEFVVRANAGSIVRGYMKASAAPAVAQLPFVQSIKLSTKE